jgi:hypothetical protein
MQPPPSTEDTEATFEQGFAQQAQTVFSNKYPELMSNVVTFKVLSSNIETGSGVGAFVMDINGEEAYAPVVLAANQLKPIEILYFKAQNTFVPLKPEWIDEISRHSDEAMGEQVKEPKHLQRDIDIRNLVIPPSTGRYAYATAGGLDDMLDPQGKGNGTGLLGTGKKLAAYLTKAPNYVKKAFVKTLEDNHAILKFAFEAFDKDMILASLVPHEKKATQRPTVEFLTVDNSTEDFRRVFGKQASEAFQIAAKLGYVMKDSRPQQNLVVETETQIRMHEAKESGLYKLYTDDGKAVNALVIASPQPFESTGIYDKRTDIATLPDTYKRLRKKTDANMVDGVDKPSDCDPKLDPVKYLVVLEDGKCEMVNFAPVGTKLVETEVTGKLKNIVHGNPDNISSMSDVFFVRFWGNRFNATKVATVQSVTTDSKGVRRIDIMSRVLVTDPKSSIHSMVAPHDSNVTYLPTNYIPIKVESTYLHLLNSPDTTLYHRQSLEKNGAVRIKVKDAGAGMFSVAGLESMPKIATIRQMITSLAIDPIEAESVLAKTAEKGSYEFYLMSPQQFRKYAVEAGESPEEEMPPTQDPAGPPMDPNTGTPIDPASGQPVDPSMMDPAMGGMAPPAPPPASPVDLAVMDVGAAYMQQAADTAKQLADTQQALTDRMTVIQQVHQRATEIAQSQATGAPPAPMAPPIPEPMMDQEQVAAGMAPEDMMAGAGAEAGVGSGPEAGMPPGMPPGPGQEEAMTQELSQGAAGPMGNAEKLHDPEAFEATAIGSMAANPDLREQVATFIPNLEEAMDNLARILLNLWMQESDFSSNMGEVDYNDLEERLRLAFNNLGALILKINQTAMSAGGNGSNEGTA